MSMKIGVDPFRRVQLLWASSMEYLCSGIAKKLCQPMVFISISVLKATSGSGEQISEHFAAMSRVQRN